MGFHHRIRTPEDAQANGFAEAFVKVLVRLKHTVVGEGTDMRHMVYRYFMAYRVTPHRMIGKSPAKFMFG